MTEKKRLLVFHPTVAPYRIDYFNDLYEAFDCRICLQYENLKDQTFDYDSISSQFRYVPQYLPQEGVKMRREISRQLREFDPDIVMTCEFGPLTLQVLLYRFLHGKKYKVAVMTDDSYDMIANGNDFSHRHRVARKLLAPKVDDAIVVDPKVAEWYQEQYGKGFFFPIIREEHRAAETYRRALPVSREYAWKYGLKGRPVVLTVSRMVDLKNLHRVIDAFELTGSDAVLVMVGDGPERDGLMAQAAASGKEIIIPGRFEGDELYAWYNLASVFVLASYREPFGAVTNEALLAGCRAVISRNAGSSCLVGPTNGECVDPMDAGQIAGAIDRQLSLSAVPELSEARGSLMGISYAERMNALMEKLNGL